MPKLAANLRYLFQEVAFLDRSAAAGEAGFRGIECLFPYEAPAAAIAERLDRHRLMPVLFNLPSGDLGSGERGCGAVPRREAGFTGCAQRALGYALATGCKRLHGLPGRGPADRAKTEGAAVLAANLRRV